MPEIREPAGNPGPGAKEALHASEGPNATYNFNDGSEEGTTTAQLAKNMLNATKARTSQKREQLEKMHEDGMQKIQKDAAMHFEAERAELSQYRLIQINKLSDLINKRATIEARILKEIEALDQNYGAARNEMAATLKGRVKDINEKQLHQVEPPR